jgi:hypothetical protein
MLGHLLWMHLNLDLSVYREFSYATVMMICDEVPSSTDLSHGVCKETKLLLERDFSIAYPGMWSILRSLKKNKDSAVETIEEIVRGDYGECLEVAFLNFKLSEDSTWIQDIEKKVGSIIHLHLFKRRSKVGKALRNGLWMALQSSETKVDGCEQKAMVKGFSELTTDNLQCIFNGRNSMTAAEFLKECVFSILLPTQLREFFEECITRMSSTEHARLSIFITGVEYFGSQTIMVKPLEGEFVTGESLPCSSTCFTTLSLPPYQDVDTMYQKIYYAIFDRSTFNP